MSSMSSAADVVDDGPLPTRSPARKRSAPPLGPDDTEPPSTGLPVLQDLRRPGPREYTSTSSTSSRPSNNYECAWTALRSKGIRAMEHFDPPAGVVDEKPEEDSELLALVKSFAEFDDDGGGGRGPGKDILAVIRTSKHANEEDFSRHLFWQVVEGFRRNKWKVYTKKGRRSRVSDKCAKRIPTTIDAAGAADATEARGGLGGGTQGAQGDGTNVVGGGGGQPVVLDDMVILGKMDEAEEEDRKPSSAPQDQGAASADASRTAAPSPAPAKKKKTYVVTVGAWKYAIGLSRKAMVREGDSSSIVRGKSYPDQSLAIYKKPVGSNDDDDDEKDGWIVHQILAVVELKMDDSACRSFAVKESTPQDDGDSSAGATLAVVDRECFTPENDLRYGPLGQVLMYVVGHVLWGRAALGLALPSRLPFAVVAGRSTKESSFPNDALRCLHGYLAVPDECGGRFFFSVDSFGAFRDLSSGGLALASYVSVLASGIRAAESWINDLAGQAQLPPPKPMSGQKLMFGSEPLESLPLVLSPVARSDDQVNEAPSPTPAATGAEGIKISQGELFRGKFNLASLRNKVPESSDVSWLVAPAPAQAAAAAADPAGTNDDNVVVKVSSRSCFGQLVDVQGYMWNHEQNREGRSWGEVCRCLSPSLHGIYSTENRFGLVQIMPDLFSEGFEPLYPYRLKERGQWSSLWAAFEGFVQGTLIPIAAVRVINPDLRPGFNCTANLLYHQRKKVIRMVDLDSLVEFGVWGLNEPVNHRYISLQRNRGQRTIRTPMDFVFKQVVVIAEAWIREVTDDKAHVDKLFAANEAAQVWTRDTSQVCDGPYVVKVLKGYRGQFGVRED